MLSERAEEILEALWINAEEQGKKPLELGASRDDPAIDECERARDTYGDCYVYFYPVFFFQYRLYSKYSVYIIAHTTIVAGTVPAAAKTYSAKGTVPKYIAKEVPNPNVTGQLLFKAI